MSHLCITYILECHLSQLQDLIWFVFLGSRREPSIQYGNEVLIYLLKDHWNSVKLHFEDCPIYEKKLNWSSLLKHVTLLLLTPVSMVCDSCLLCQVCLFVRNTMVNLLNLLIIPQAYYYSAIIEDVILRFAWTIQISITSMTSLPHSGDIIATVFAPLEVFR